MRKLYFLLLALLFSTTANAQSNSGRIVFSIGGDLYTIQPDGSDLKTLLDDECYNTAQQVSPDGTRLAIRSVGCDEWGIRILDLDTGDIELLTEEDYSTLSPSWTRIATIRPAVQSRYNTRLFEVYFRELGQESETHIGSGIHDRFNPLWSPDGRYIAYESLFGKGGKSVVGVYDTAAREWFSLNRKDRIESSSVPAWSPDGETLAFMTEDGIALVDYSFNRDAAVYKDPKDGVYEMYWSPDSQSIALVGFTSYQETVGFLMPAIRILNVNSGEITVLNPRDKNGFNPSWSPDGSQLVYASDEIISVETTPYMKITEIHFHLHIWDGQTIHTIYTTKRTENITRMQISEPQWLP